jgi:hypothetical protein
MPLANGMSCIINWKKAHDRLYVFRKQNEIILIWLLSKSLLLGALKVLTSSPRLELWGAPNALVRVNVLGYSSGKGKTLSHCGFPLFAQWRQMDFN